MTAFMLCDAKTEFVHNTLLSNLSVPTCQRYMDAPSDMGRYTSVRGQTQMKTSI